MKIKYFSDTDTLYIEFHTGDIVQTTDLDEDTQIDLDANGRLCAMTVEHASRRTGIPEFSYEQVSA